jgi:hypothetical protein
MQTRTWHSGDYYRSRTCKDVQYLNKSETAKPSFRLNYDCGVGDFTSFVVLTNLLQVQRCTDCKSIEGPKRYHLSFSGMLYNTYIHATHALSPKG